MQTEKLQKIAVTELGKMCESLRRKSGKAEEKRKENNFTEGKKKLKRREETV